MIGFRLTISLLYEKYSTKSAGDRSSETCHLGEDLGVQALLNLASGLWINVK